MTLSDKNRLRLAGFVLCILISAVAARAGWIEDGDGKTVIHVKVYAMPQPGAVDPGSKASELTIREFKKSFPKTFAGRYRGKYESNPKKYGKHNWDKVEIELHPFTGIQVEGVEVDLLAIAGGMAPDVLYVNFKKSDTYIQNSFLHPLDKPEDGYFTGLTQEEIDYKINPKIWPVIRRKGPDGGTHVWAMPIGGMLGKVLLYRKDIFEEKNIPFPTYRWTWNDLLDAAKKITDPEKGVYGILLGRGRLESWFWVNYLWSAGGEVMKYDEGKDQWRCCFDTEEAAEALDFYIRLSAEKWTDRDGKVRRGYSSKESADSWTKWDRGEIGMLYSYIDERMFAQLDPELTGLAPVPMGPSGKRGGEINCQMAGLFSDIREPAVRDAAWEYLRFLNSPVSGKISTDVLVESGMGQFVNPKYLKMYGYEDIIRLCPKGWAEAFDMAMESGNPEPYGRGSNIAYDMMTYPIAEAELMERDGRLPENRGQRLGVLRDLLKKGCEKANEKMIGIIPEPEKRKRTVVAYIVIALIAGAFYFVFRKVVSSFSSPETSGAKRSGWDFGRYKYAYLLLLPAVLSILVWNYAPLVRGSLMAFQDYRILGESKFTGVENIANVLFSADWWMAIYNSLRYSLLIIGLTFLPPIILAILLQEVPMGKLLFRIIFYLPAVVSGIVTVLLWRQFYEPSEFGALNMIVMRIPVAGFFATGAVFFGIAFMFAKRLWYHGMRWQSGLCLAAGVLMMLAAFGLAGPAIFLKGESSAQGLANIFGRLLNMIPEPYGWLINPKTAMLSCIIPMVWAGVGPGCLIYLAALKGIADDFYEAADIDGATFIDKIVFVVFPILKPLIIINFIGVFIGSVYSEGNILAMTGGGANTEVAGLHIWYSAFTYLKYGPATAMAWMLGAMLIGFTVYQLKMLSRLEFKTTDKKV
jgi:multiple sugar transport system permease protein